MHYTEFGSPGRRQNSQPKVVFTRQHSFNPELITCLVALPCDDARGRWSVTAFVVNTRKGTMDDRMVSFWTAVSFETVESIVALYGFSPETEPQPVRPFFWLGADALRNAS